MSFRLLSFTGFLSSSCVLNLSLVSHFVLSTSCFSSSSNCEVIWSLPSHLCTYNHDFWLPFLMWINGNEVAQAVTALWLLFHFFFSKLVPMYIPHWSVCLSLISSRSQLSFPLSLTLFSEIQVSAADSTLFPLCVLSFSHFILRAKWTFSCFVFLYTEVYSYHCCCFMTHCRPKLYLHSRSCLAAARNIHWLLLKTFSVLAEQSAKVYQKFISCEPYLLPKFYWRF